MENNSSQGNIKELATALAKAQGEMKNAAKDSANPFFKSKYADLASVVEAIRAPFAKYGLSYLQRVEESAKDEVKVETILFHESGESFSLGVLALPVTKADAQGYGSALTYARRYSLSLLGVAPEDDDGNAAVSSTAMSGNHPSAKPPIMQPQRKSEQSPASAPVGSKDTNGDFITEAQGKRMFAIAKGAGWSNDALKTLLKTFYNTEHSYQIKKHEYDSIIKDIETMSPDPEPEAISA